MYKFKLPDIGEGLHEAEIANWLVREGETVTQDQPILEVETDKAVVEIPAPVPGVITQIAIPAGEVAKVGDLLVVIEPVGRGEGKEIEEIRETKEIRGNAPKSVGQEAGLRSGIAGPGERIVASPVARKKALALGVDLRGVKGSGPSGRIMVADVEAAATAEKTTNEKQQKTAVAYGATEAMVVEQQRDMVAQAQQVPSQEMINEKPLAAPAVRKLAQELGVDLRYVRGSMENGRVIPEDVRAYMEAAALRGRVESREEETEAASLTEGGQVVEAAIASVVDEEMSERVALRGLRRRIAQRMGLAWQVPHVTTFNEVDVSGLVALRTQLKPLVERRGGRLTYMPLIIKIVTQVLKEFPKFNASLDLEAEEIIYHRYYHIGVATAIEAGLVVPVIKHADQQSIFALAEQLEGLTERAHERKLPPNQLTGSTFTISNFGSKGGYFGTPIINPPEVAILGCGRIQKKAIVLPDDTIAARPMLPLSLSFDHRLIDGADAEDFNARLAALLGSPETLLLDLV